MSEHVEKYTDLYGTEYFWLSRKMLVVVGNWPYMPLRRKYLFRFIILGALLNGIPFMINELIHLWKHDKKKAAHVLAPLLTLGMCLTKYFNFSVHHISILTLLSRMYNNWKIAVGEEHKILLFYGEYAKSMSRLYARMIYVAMVIFLLTPLTPAMADVIKPLNESRPKHLLFPAKYAQGIEPEDYYTVMTIHTGIGVFAAITILVASDVFFINVVTHACCLFAIARHWLEHVSDGIPDLSIHLHDFNVDNPAHDPELTQLCINRIAYGVAWHNKALNYSSLVQDTFTTGLLMILCMNMLLISFTGFQILTQKDRWDDILIGMTYIFGQLCHLYLLSLPGQLLVDESGSVRDSITKSYSYDLPVKAQKMLVTILMRALRTSKITAGKFFVLEMETFMSVLQASISYFTVLANFS